MVVCTHTPPHSTTTAVAVGESACRTSPPPPLSLWTVGLSCSGGGKRGRPSLPSHCPPCMPPSRPPLADTAARGGEGGASRVPPVHTCTPPPPPAAGAAASWHPAPHPRLPPPRAAALPLAREYDTPPPSLLPTRARVGRCAPPSLAVAASHPHTPRDVATVQYSTYRRLGGGGGGGAGGGQTAQAAHTRARGTHILQGPRGARADTGVGHAASPRAGQQGKERGGGGEGAAAADPSGEWRPLPAGGNETDAEKEKTMETQVRVGWRGGGGGARAARPARLGGGQTVLPGTPCCREGGRCAAAAAAGDWR